MANFQGHEINIDARSDWDILVDEFAGARAIFRALSNYYYSSGESSRSRRFESALDQAEMDAYEALGRLARAIRDASEDYNLSEAIRDAERHFDELSDLLV